MGDFNHPDENNNNQEQSMDETQNQQSAYDQQETMSQQPQYQQSQYGGQSQYQQGYPNYPYQQYQPEPKKNNGFAIASLICGIVSIVLCCIWYLSLPVSIVGLVLGILSLRKTIDGKNMAIVGIVLSSIGIFIAVIAIAGTVLMVNNGEFWDTFYEQMEKSSY